MAAIRCGHCGGEHASVAEVRACALEHPDTTTPPPDDGDGGGGGAWEDAPPPLDDPPSRGASRPGAERGARSRSGRPTPAAAASSPQPTEARPGAAGPGRRGPVVLGRSVVVRPGAPTPLAWAGVARLRVDHDDTTLQRLREAWAARTPLVLELDDAVLGGPDAPPSPIERREPWVLAPGFDLPGEELHHLVWSNALDGRDPTASPTWRWADLAVARGARPAPTDADADVVMPDGGLVWCDGGPVQPIEGVVHRIHLEHGALTPFGPEATRPSPDVELAPDQRAAVDHPGGPVRIIAPAGSGKTRVLSERAARLRRAWGVPASAMVVVAYNVRARQELRERTPALPAGRIDTLNALGRKILDGQAPFAPRPDRRTLIDEREVRATLDRLVRFPRRANADPAATWIEALSSVRLGLRDPAEVEAAGGGDLPGFAEVFGQYRATLAARGVLDFDEQIYGTLEALLTEPATRAAARRACRLLLVDEFQDLTPAHLLLVRLLSGPERAVFGVGDDDQTIYGYAGASPDWLIRYADHFPGAASHPLEVNYRCPPAVVAAAATLLGHNRQRVEKVIRAAPGRPVDPSALRIVAADDVVAATVDAVGAALAAGHPPGEVAVLARVHAALAPVQVALAHHGVPVVKAVDASYVRRTGVAAALAWLRLATSPRRFGRGDVLATVRRPSRGLSPRVAEWMGEQRDLEGLRRLAGRLQGRDAEKVEGYADDVALLAGMASGATTTQLLKAVRDRIGLDAALDALDASKGGLRGSAQGDDLDALVALGSLHPDPTTFGPWLHAALEAPGAAAGEGVTVATVHAVKGLEWPQVVVHDASAGLFPHRLSEDDEEERRVFHVALTRASERATVVAPAGAPSPFVADLTTPAPPPGTPPRIIRSAPPRPVTPAPKASAAAGASGPAAEALRTWRRQRAADDGVPAYVVFSNATLDAIAAAKPTSLVALGRVKGMGPTKLARYGNEVLAVLNGA